jgi:hypothetical protein
MAAISAIGATIRQTFFMEKGDGPIPTSTATDFDDCAID